MEYRFTMILFLALSLVFFSIVSSKNKSLKEFRFRTILYLLLTGLVAGAIGLISWGNLITSSETILFYIFLAWMFAIGLLHLFLSEKILPWAAKAGFWGGFLFTLSAGLLGGVFLLLAFNITGYSAFVRINLTALLLFLLPFLFYSAFMQYLNVPVKILRQWFYPADKHIEDPSDREMESPLVVAFEFRKKAGDGTITSFRAKAPKEMGFGKLFYYFINDYNDRNPDEAIEFLNEKKRPYGWIFYFKPKWFRKIRYIDPEETVSFNFIKENSIIVCKRIIEK